MTISLYERMQRYEAISNNLLVPKLPIIAKCNIRNFTRMIRKLSRPYDSELWTILRNTMHDTVMELESAVFAYQQHGEICYVLKTNDDDGPGPYGGNSQKIVSVISSLTTVNFIKNFLASDEPPDIIGEGIFECFTFNVPFSSEVVNYLIYQQQQCQKYAISAAAEEELSRVIENIDFLNKRTTEEKKELLETECGIIFNNSYNQFFRLGSCSFKTPRIINEIARKKWFLETNAPYFINEKEFVLNIINTGQDIFRHERDM